MCMWKKVVLSTSKVNAKHTKSCGCKTIFLISQGSIKDNRTKDSLYDVYAGMLARCNNPKSTGFHNYGGRGIKVCQEWLDDFYVFKNDVGPRPSNNHTLDRIDPNKNYCKENCRWATRKEQSSNLRTNRKFTYLNRTLTLSEWSRVLNLPKSTIDARLKYGWTVEQTLSTPRRARAQRKR